MKRLCSLVAVIVIAVLVFFSCDNNSPKFADKDVQEGYDLAQVHCKSCHQLPTPDLLNKLTWATHIMPKMGELVGFRSLGLASYIENGRPTSLKLSQWNNIVKYFTTQAPDQLPTSGAARIDKNFGLFTVQFPSFGVKSPATTLVNINMQDSVYFFADGVTRQLYRMSATNEIKDSFSFSTGISDIKLTDTSLIALTMGVLYPSDTKEGKLFSYDLRTKKTTTILDTLQRPVNTSFADLNNDGLEDIVVCEFGNIIGQLSWFQNNGHSYTKHILRSLPGAVKSVIIDCNKDGKPDIMSLMAQGDEGIFLYYNEGNNNFREQRVLQFPPSYGSNYFELADFNNDGYPDIIVTAGDNGDYPPILKHYHGIRIYQNNGAYDYKEAVFLPVNGVGKAIARDFDGDGDLDIVSISFFPDYINRPEESVIYWENTGKLSFKPHSFPEALAGRWITMDAGDIDKDGDTDIILGNANFSIGAVPADYKRKWELHTPSVLILINQLPHSKK